jgi:hypothetical protein
MNLSLNLRGGLWVVVGLCGGIALGALLPSDSSAGLSSGASAQKPMTAQDASALSAPLQEGAGISVSEGGGKGVFRGSLEAEAAGSLGKLPPEKLIALFEKVSNLKSDSRKYILAYRIASQLEVGQIEGALKSALQDLSDGDYVTTRALARRWVELDPQAAAAKALELKQQHLIVPIMESWSRLDSAAPLKWALEQPEDTKVDATRQLLVSRMLAPQQLEKLVMTAADSPTEAMRSQIFPFATARLAESNPQGALHAASAIEDAEVRQRTVGMVLGRLGQSSPEIGKAWLASQPDLAPQERAVYEQILANPRPPRRGNP